MMKHRNIWLLALRQQREQQQQQQQQQQQPLAHSGNNYYVRGQYGVRMPQLKRAIFYSGASAGAVLALLLALTFLHGAGFYAAQNWTPVVGDKRLRLERLLRLRDEYDNLTESVLAAVSGSSAANLTDVDLTRQLLRLREMGANMRSKAVLYQIRQLQLRPTFHQSMYFSVTYLSLIGYGDVVGASDLNYFFCCLGAIVTVPVWHLYHHRLFSLSHQLLLLLLLRFSGTADRRPTQAEERRSFGVEFESGRLAAEAMMRQRERAFHLAQMYTGNRMYICNIAVFLLLGAACFGVFAASQPGLSLPDVAWLTVQTAFHVGLGDLPTDGVHWATLLAVMSALYLAYFQCFSFICPATLTASLSQIRRFDFFDLLQEQDAYSPAPMPQFQAVRRRISESDADG